MKNFNISNEAMTLLTEAGGKIDGEWISGFWKRGEFAKLAGAEHVSTGKHTEGYYLFPISGEKSRIVEITDFRVNVITGEVEINDHGSMKPALHFQEYWYEDLQPALLELCKVAK